MKHFIPSTSQLFHLTLGIACLAAATSARADTIYSNLLDTAIPLDFTGTTIIIGSGELNPFFGGVGVANNASLQPYRTGSGGLDTILNFSAGATIDASNLHLATGPGGSQDHLGSTFTAGQEGYVGFQLDGANYGWARVVFTNNAAGAVVRDWAYDNSGAAIVVGGIRQVGQDMVISAGAAIASNLQDSGGATNLVHSSDIATSLTGTNTHSGTTSVTSGSLAVDGSGSINNSNVSLGGGTFRYNSSVAYSGSLGFTNGTIGGTNLTGTLGGLEIGAGQTLAPGADNGTGATQTTSQTWTGGGTLQWQINDAAGSAGSASGWDLLTGSGSLSITAASSDPFTIAITSLGLNQVGGDALGFNSAATYHWLIADFSSPLGFAAEAFAVDSSGFSNTFAGTFGVARGDQTAVGDDSQLYLTYTAIPEPQMLPLVVLGFLSLARRRRCFVRPGAVASVDDRRRLPLRERRKGQAQEKELNASHLPDAHRAPLHASHSRVSLNASRAGHNPN